MTSDSQRVPAVNIMWLTKDTALQTLVAGRGEEVRLSGLGLEKNRGKSHLGAQGPGTAGSPSGPPAITGSVTRDRAKELLPRAWPIRPCHRAAETQAEALLAISLQRRITSYGEL